MKTQILVACFSNNNGGMELNAIGFAKIFSRQHDVVLACRKGSYIASCRQDLEKQNIQVEVIDFLGSFSFNCILQVRRLLKKKHIKNLILFGTSEMKSIFFATLGLKTQVLNFHGTAKKHNKNDWFHRWIFTCVNYHVAVSEKRIKLNVLKIIPGATDENVKVIYLPCDDRFDGEKQLSEPYKLIHVGRICESKGQEECMRVVQFLSQQKMNVELLFLGGVEDPQFMKKLQSLQKNDSILADKVKFAGFSTQVHQEMSRAHFLLFPSYGEGLPNALIEAFLAKTLPITFNNSVFPELLDMGFRFPQAEDRNISDLCAKTQKTLQMTTEDYKKMVNHNYALALELFSSENILKEYNKLFI